MARRTPRLNLPAVSGRETLPPPQRLLPLYRRHHDLHYYALPDPSQPHSVGGGRSGLAAALARIEARTLVVGITTDIIFAPGEMRELHVMIPGSRYREIDSPFGHDGFLVEHEQLDGLLSPFMEN